MNSNSFSSSPRKNKFEIRAEVLESCLYRSRTQSWLLRHLRLKTSSIKQSLSFLLTAELIELVDSFEAPNEAKEYRTTEKGEEALTQYYQLLTKFIVK